jgi:1-deoxy-D-xylulose-5-phosphate synthase
MENTHEKIKIGTGRRMRSGDDLAILSIGPIGLEATKALEELDANGISAAHYDMRFAKPLDEMLLHEIFGKFEYVVTVEDGCVQGGMGSAILEFMADNEYKVVVKRLGIPDQFIEHGTQAELYRECGFDCIGIVAICKELIGEKRKKLVG